MMDNSESQKTDIDAMGQHDRKVRATKMNSTSSEQPTKSSITTSTDDGNPYPQPDDVWIAVMGMTGVGKSTFISLLAGYDIGIGHELQSMTQHVGLYRCSGIFNKTIWFVDTPGFDDSSRPDVEVLQEISTFFAQLYDNEIRFSGILYLQRITDPRIGGSAVKNLELLKSMCGVRAFSIVRLVTTRWNVLKTDSEHHQAVEREEQLVSDDRFFKPFLDNGARLFRLETLDVAAAKVLVKSLLYPEHKIDLSIQFEMVTQRKRLDKTNAGRYMGQSQALERQRYELEIRELEDSMNEAIRERDEMAMEEIAAERRDFQAKREKLLRDQEEMMIDFTRLQRREIRDSSRTTVSKHATEHSQHDSKSTSGRHAIEDFPPPPRRHTTHIRSSPTSGPKIVETITTKTTVTRYHALEAGTLRDLPRGTTGNNQIERIKKWLVRTLI